MKHIELLTLLYKYRKEIDRAFHGEPFEDLPDEITKEVPIFQKVAKKYELSDNYRQFANAMLKRVDANYRFGDYNEEIRFLIEQKGIFQETNDREILNRIKKLTRTLYMKIEERDSLINARINDIINDNDLSLELIIKDAKDVDGRITELIGAHNAILKVLGHELRGLDEELDELLVDIGIDLLPFTSNIHTFNSKLSDFILRTEKRKKENKDLMSLANKILKEQDYEMRALLLSGYQNYQHTLRERKNSSSIKSLPTSSELKTDSFLELLTKSIEIEKVERKASYKKPYQESQETIFKAVNIRKVKEDLKREKPHNIFDFILAHKEISKFKDEGDERIYAFKAYLTIIQDYREKITLKEEYMSNIKVAQWI